MKALVISLLLVSSVHAKPNRLPTQAANAPKCSKTEDTALKNALTKTAKNDPGRKGFTNVCVDCSFAFSEYLGKTDSGKDQWKTAVETKEGKCYTYYLVNTYKTSDGECSIYGEPLESNLHDCEG